MNIVFLDIDGVIQPYNTSIDLNNKIIKKVLIQKFGVDYLKYDSLELYDVYYNWNKKALERLREILQQTNSKIIVSSDWRDENKPYKIKDYLRIHQLDDYWFEDNIIDKKYGMNPFKKRYMEISQSIYDYPITNFVILDDMVELKKYYPDNFVETYNYLSRENVNDAIRILKH